MGNLKLAQKFLGHSTIKMTAGIYTSTRAPLRKRNATLQSLLNGCANYGDLFPLVPLFPISRYREQGNRNNFAALN